MCKGFKFEDLQWCPSLSSLPCASETDFITTASTLHKFESVWIYLGSNTSEKKWGKGFKAGSLENGSDFVQEVTLKFVGWKFEQSWYIWGREVDFTLTLHIHDVQSCKPSSPNPVFVSNNTAPQILNNSSRAQFPFHPRLEKSRGLNLKGQNGNLDCSNRCRWTLNLLFVDPSNPTLSKSWTPRRKPWRVSWQNTYINITPQTLNTTRPVNPQPWTLKPSPIIRVSEFSTRQAINPGSEFNLIKWMMETWILNPSPEFYKASFWRSFYSLNFLDRSTLNLEPLNPKSLTLILNRIWEWMIEGCWWMRFLA